MKRVKITVTRDDIKAGVRGSVFRCPVALAVLRQLLPGFTVEVTNARIMVTPPETDHWRVEPAEFWLNRRAAWAITRYDITGKMEPFSFYLDIL
jgi:hypothetical protein